jgi:hypothetical protein
MLKKLLGTITAQKHEQRRAELYRNLIRREAKIGGQLFGPVPKGGRREFFCLDEYTWVWHEEWIDANGKKQIKTTRYDIRPTGVMKVQDGQPSQYVSLNEGRRLYRAVGLYRQRVDSELYSFV